jgi:NTP pyrophosphatase (non-canonical NTP hydrolase)
VGDFDEYQAFAATTAIHPRETRLQELAYLALGLTGEAGEVAGKVKKIIRDSGGVITLQNELDIAHELGDVLWYVARVADVLSFDLSDVVAANVDKLRSRRARGVIGGSGDNR